MGNFVMAVGRSVPIWHGSQLSGRLREQLTPLTLMGLWIAVVSGLQAMLVEDFEFYAVYESSYSGLAFSFLTFKPLEYLCEVVAVFMVLRGGAWVQSGLRGVKGRLNLAIAP